MSKKIVALMLLVVFVLAACTPQAAAPDSANAGDKVEVRFWMHQNPAFEASYKALADAYTAAHPDVTITIETFDYDTYIQTLQTALPAGEEADIMQMFGSWVCSYSDRLDSVPGDVLSMDQANEIFYAASIGGFTCGGELKGVPQEFNIEYGGVLVNKAMFDAAGVAYPPAWATLDDMAADAAMLTKYDDADVMVQAGLDFLGGDTLPFMFMAGILQRGGDYWNADQTAFTFNTPEAKETLEWMNSLVAEHKVVDSTLFASDLVVDDFFGGRSAMSYIGPWAVATGLTNFPEFGEFGYVMVPYIGDQPTFAADSGWGLTVSPNSKNAAVAWDFIKFVTMDPANALQWNIGTATIPALVANTDDPKLVEALPFIENIKSQLEYGRYIGNMPDRDQVFYNIIHQHILNVFQGIETVDDALKAIDEETNATLQ